jgi:hypothetical protein
MMKLALALLLLVSCGPKSAAPSEHSAGTGEVGAVCSCGERADETSCKAVECREGLTCGYGCGIPGCDSTCMTPEEFEQSKTIP